MIHDRRAPRRETKRAVARLVRCAGLRDERQLTTAISALGRAREAEAAVALLVASVAARIETLSAWAEERVAKADAAAEAARAEAARLTMELANAPNRDVLRAQSVCRAAAEAARRGKRTEGGERRARVVDRATWRGVGGRGVGVAWAYAAWAGTACARRRSSRPTRVRRAAS